MAKKPDVRTPVLSSKDAKLPSTASVMTGYRLATVFESGTAASYVSSIATPIEDPGTSAASRLLPSPATDSDQPQIAANVEGVTALDVAEYILAKLGEMTAWKLQKLVYYSQAWSLVWDQRPLFGDRIEAWANGPVCPNLYSRHRGQFKVFTITGGDQSRLDGTARETVDAVLAYYGDKHPQWLSDLTHQEPPWLEARQGLDAGMRGDREITPAALVEYYGSLPPGS